MAEQGIQWCEEKPDVYAYEAKITNLFLLITLTLRILRIKQYRGPGEKKQQF